MADDEHFAQNLTVYWESNCTEISFDDCPKNVPETYSLHCHIQNILCPVSEVTVNVEDTFYHV